MRVASIARCIEAGGLRRQGLHDHYASSNLNGWFVIVKFVIVLYDKQLHFMVSSCHVTSEPYLLHYAGGGL